MYIKNLSLKNIKMLSILFEDNSDKYNRYNKPEFDAVKELEKHVGKILIISPDEFYDLRIPVAATIAWHRISRLKLYLRFLPAFPDCIFSMKLLTHLDLGGNSLRSIPESICELTSLRYLSLRFNLLTTLPNSIGRLQALNELHLEDNRLKTLPLTIGQLKSLRYFGLTSDQIEVLPSSVKDILDELKSQGCVIGAIYKMYIIKTEEESTTDKAAFDFDKWMLED